MTKLIKISEAADKLGVSRQRIYQLIEEGRVFIVAELYGIKLVDDEKITPDLIKRKDKKDMNSAKPDKKVLTGVKKSSKVKP